MVRPYASCPLQGVDDVHLSSSFFVLVRPVPCRNRRLPDSGSIDVASRCRILAKMIARCDIVLGSHVMSQTAVRDSTERPASDLGNSRTYTLSSHTSVRLRSRNADRRKTGTPRTPVEITYSPSRRARARAPPSLLPSAEEGSTATSTTCFSQEDFHGSPPTTFRFAVGSRELSRDLQMFPSYRQGGPPAFLLSK